jgi:hypothetical protein
MPFVEMTSADNLLAMEKWFRTRVPETVSSIFHSHGENLKAKAAKTNS